MDKKKGGNDRFRGKPLSAVGWSPEEVALKVVLKIMAIKEVQDHIRQKIMQLQLEEEDYATYLSGCKDGAAMVLANIIVGNIDLRIIKKDLENSEVET